MYALDMLVHVSLFAEGGIAEMAHVRPFPLVFCALMSAQLACVPEAFITRTTAVCRWYTTRAGAVILSGLGVEEVFDGLLRIASRHVGCVWVCVGE